jgi:hypothetical protein
LRVGPGVHASKPGDEVVAHCLSVELEGPDGHNDAMLDSEPFGASVYVARRGGTIVTCASTSGYEHQFDNRSAAAQVSRSRRGSGRFRPAAARRPRR